MALDWLARPILIVFIIIFILQSTNVSSISESDALIKLKNSFTNASALSSWVNGSAPCNGETQWSGLLCRNGIVIGIRLEKMGLSGKIDVDALVDISGLISVSFARNSFSGSIPQLSRLGYLKSIFLTGNQFSGEIPPDFFLEMVSLKKIWLSDNQFSGYIPSSLIHLSNLLELRLENNEFSGTIPSINQSTLRTFNVSNNKLRGQIPTSLEKFKLSSFLGNYELCGEKIGKECKIEPAIPVAAAAEEAESSFESNDASIVDDNDAKRAKIAAIGILVAMVLCVAAAILFKLVQKEKDFEVGGNDGNVTDEAVEVQITSPVGSKEMKATKKTGSVRKGGNQNKHGRVPELVIVNDEKGVFGLQDLLKAAAEVLGNGGLGCSYKASMINAEAVVVKRMREMNALRIEGFDAEIRNLGRLKHPNILAPLAFHYRKDEKLLIYDYMPKGSLLYLLHGDTGSSHAELTWPVRLKIIEGIARGLGHLHAELAFFELPHGNLKSSNIFLTPDNEPVISEFGFNQLIDPPVARRALLAYKAPEAANSGVSPKCDVYCLGIVILEILTGKLPSQYLNPGIEEIDLVQWVKASISQGTELELLDPDIVTTSGSTNSPGEMRAVFQIGVCCAESNPEQRLDLREAIERIEEIQFARIDSGNRDGYSHTALFDPSNSTKGGLGESSKTNRGSYSFANSSQFSFASPDSQFLSNEN